MVFFKKMNLGICFQLTDRTNNQQESGENEDSKETNEGKKCLKVSEDPGVGL